MNIRFIQTGPGVYSKDSMNQISHEIPQPQIDLSFKKILIHGNGKFYILTEIGD